MSSVYSSSSSSSSSDGEPFIYESDNGSWVGCTENEFLENLRLMRENDPYVSDLYANGSFEHIQEMTDEDWVQLGHDISHNDYLDDLNLYGGLDDRKTALFFQGLTRSNTLKRINLINNGIGVSGIQSMIPFLSNSNLVSLCVEGFLNDIKPEGFSLLFQALHNRPIERLHCNACSLDSIKIDSNIIPRYLKVLSLAGSYIDAEGCREVAKLLQKKDPTLISLHLNGNKIDDEGVSVLVSALQNNTSLKKLDLSQNNDITSKGGGLLLKLVNDISSIKATMQSNHTLQTIVLPELDVDYRIYIYDALRFNVDYYPRRPGPLKVKGAQLHSEQRAVMCRLQGVEQSNAALYKHVDPFILPEVLSLVGRIHGRGELFVALLSSIAGIISTVNREKYLEEQKAFHEAKLKAINADLAAIRNAKSETATLENDQQSRKRLRQN
mmetsp:Transcript_27812/g.40776  ORF Transcript_27812/g.40776 Transcript_27812/m.40776 type:complete len:439 (+) Transcript_27812:103-1419(+)